MPLPGGQGTAWQAGEIVLKPLDMSTQELEWQAGVLPGVGNFGVRVAAPLRARTGALVVDGWTGWPPWDEAASPEHTPGSSLEWLLDARRPILLPDQLIHGDLSGNVLLAEGNPPAVIDFSPYWRPKEYATAIVLVDAVVSYGADGQLLDLLGGEQGTQLLLRAAIFRLLSDSEPAAGYYAALVARLRVRLGRS